MLLGKSFNPLDLTSKKVLVTGASSGIGRACAIFLSKLNAQIVIVGRNEDRLNQTFKLLEGKGHIKIAYDLTQDDLCDLFENAVSDKIKLNGLVHCAGVSQLVPLRSLTKNKILEEMSINFFSFIELVRMFARNRFNSGGSIVAVSSIAAVRAEQCQTSYAASKAAVDIACQALSSELARQNIRINTVLPGAVATEGVLESKGNQVDIEKIANRQLFGMGTPDEVAATCAFLISDMAKFTTGRRFFVDGGRFL